MRKSFFSLSILYLAAFSLVFSGCGKKKDLNQTKRFVRVCISSPIRSLDPRVGIERPAINAINMLFEGLMTRDSEGKLAMGQAERVEISEDQKVYTFYIRPAYWSNGDPVTAKDFEYAWKKAIDPETAQMGAFLFNPIKNASRCLEKKAFIHEVGISAISDQILVIELEHPTPYFLELTASTPYSPIPHKVALKDKKWAFCNIDLLVSNGPFLMRQWRKGKSLTLEKNPYYWDSENVAIPGICLYVVQEDSIRHLMYEQGQLDWMGDPLSPLSYDALEVYQEKKDINVSDVYGINWLFINTKCPPLDNKNIRKALSYAVNRKNIVESLANTASLPTCRIFSQGDIDEGQDCFMDDDQVYAQLLFRSALSELRLEHEDFPEITLSYNAVGNQAEIVHLIQNQWEKVLGIKVKLALLGKTLLFNQICQGNYQIGSMFWVSIIEDPIYMLNTFRSGHARANLSRWVNKKYQTLLSQSDYEQNPENRKKILVEAEKLLMEEMPIIPVCFGRALYMKDEKLENVSVSHLMEIDFKHATFTDK